MTTNNNKTLHVDLGDIELRAVLHLDPDVRRAWLLRPVTRGILASTTYTRKSESGAGCGPVSGPREPILGSMGHFVGWHRGAGIRS